MSPFPKSIWQSPAAKWHFILPTTTTSQKVSLDIHYLFQFNTRFRLFSTPKSSSIPFPTRLGHQNGTSTTTRSMRKSTVQPYSGTRIFPLVPNPSRPGSRARWCALVRTVIWIVTVNRRTAIATSRRRTASSIVTLPRKVIATRTTYIPWMNFGLYITE